MRLSRIRKLCKWYGIKSAIMQIKYSAKARQHIGSTIDYYLDHFGRQAALNLAYDIDAKVKSLEKFPEIGFPEPLLKDKAILYRALIVGRIFELSLKAT